MDIGLCIFATDYAIRIDELAREAEARGFESLFVPEHTHIPVSRRTRLLLLLGRPRRGWLRRSRSCAPEDRTKR